MTTNAELKTVVRNWIANRILSTNDDYLASNNYVKFHQVEEESATSGVYSTILKDADTSGQIEFIDTLDDDEKGQKYIVLRNSEDEIVPIYNEDSGVQLSVKSILNDYIITAICYGNGKYVAIIDGVYMAHSTDGITFTIGTEPIEVCNAITYGNGKFVAVGMNVCAYSTDGITFTTGTIPEGEYYDVAYGDSKFVAVSHDGVCAYSTNGETFTAGTCPPVHFDAIAYGDGKFVAVGVESDDYTSSAYSTDGITFTEGELQYGCSYIAYGDGKFVAACSSGCLYSTDGITFSEDPELVDYDIAGLAYGNSKFVVITSDGICASSTDGITFTNRGGFNALFATVPKSLRYCNNEFIAFGSSNDEQFMASIDFNEGNVFSESIDWTAEKEAQISTMLSGLSELSVPEWLSEADKTKFAQYKTATKYEIQETPANVDKKMKLVGLNMFNDAVDTLENRVSELEQRLAALISAFEADPEPAEEEP